MGLDGKGSYCFGFDVLRDVFTDIGVADEFSPDRVNLGQILVADTTHCKTALTMQLLGCGSEDILNYGRKQEALSGSAGNCNVSLSLSLAMSFPGLRQEFIQNTELLEFGIGSFSLGMGFFLRKDLRGSTSLRSATNLSGALQEVSS